MSSYCYHTRIFAFLIQLLYIQFEHSLHQIHNIINQRLMHQSSESMVDENCCGEYEVEEILKKRIKNGKPQYFIKWLGWDRPEDLTWEPLGNLVGIPDLIEQFEQKNALKKKISQQKKIKKPTGRRVRKRETPSSDEQQVVESEQFSNEKSSRDKIGAQMNSQMLNQSKSQPKPQNCEVSKSTGKDQSFIRTINYFFIQNKEIYYDVDFEDSEGRMIGVKKVHARMLASQAKQKLREFLEEYLIQIDDV